MEEGKTATLLSAPEGASAMTRTQRTRIVYVYDWYVYDGRTDSLHEDINEDDGDGGEGGGGARGGRVETAET